MGLRMFLPLSDSVKEISELAFSILQRVVLVKCPSFVTDNFAKLICALNGFYTHETFRMAWATKGRAVVTRNRSFSLNGFPLRRQKIYDLIMESMSPLQKLKCIKDLVQLMDVYLETNQKTAPLPSKMDSSEGSALLDALRILASDGLEIKFLELDTLTEGDENNEDDSKTAESKKEAEIKLIQDTIKEVIVPALLSLKNQMETVRSVFQNELRFTLYSLLWPYRSKLEYLLDNDVNFRKQVVLEYGRNEYAYINRKLFLEIRQVNPTRSNLASMSVFRPTTGDMMRHNRGLTAPRTLMNATFTRRNSDVINGTPNKLKNKWAADLNSGTDENVQDDVLSENFLGTPLRVKGDTPMRTNTPGVNSVSRVRTSF